MTKEQKFNWTRIKRIALVLVAGVLILWIGADVPIEAKAERNLQAKSLGIYRTKFAPTLAVRTSLADPHETEGLWDVPLYALGPMCRRLLTVTGAK